MDSTTQRGIAPSSGEESASRMTMEQPPPGADGWKTASVEVRKAANGGFIVRCSKERDPQPQTGGGPGAVSNFQTYKSDELAFQSIDQVLKYVTSEFAGGQATAEPMSPDNGAPAGDGDYDDEDMA